MLTTPVLSQCTTCSATELTEGAFGDAMAECISCGKRFLLPLTSSLPANGTDVTSANNAAPSISEAGSVIRPRWNLWRAVASVLSSVMLNAGILFLLGLFYFHVSSESGHVLNAEFVVDGNEDFVLCEDLDAGGGAPAKALLQTTVEMSDLTVTKTGTVASNDGTLPGGVGKLGLGAGAGGRGMGIFGGGGSAKSFAYVVDASGSMSGLRMPLVLKEMEGSIRALTEDQKFFVVFFNERTFPMMWPKIEKELIGANDLNKDRVLKWANLVEPMEATMPEQALRMALKLKPDVVYFLTDGDITAGALRIVKKYRKQGTTVNTICVGAEAAVPMMQQIAVVGHGEFLMVGRSSTIDGL